MSEPESKLGAGTVLDDRYELSEEIARGGFGRVYQAEQLNMNREVAIKMVPPKFMDLPDVVQRFEREARLASRLNHPNTITVHDYGRHGDYLFLVMELLEGEDLADILAREHQVDLDRIARIGRQVLKSLNEAHQHNIIHRDLKPENIFLTEISGEKDFVKVVDFGIAKLAMSEMNSDEMTDEDDTHRSLTVEGNTVGTPTYMSPEQAAGGDVDNRSDLYALGVILYEMAAGRPPFDHDNPAKLMRMHIFKDVPDFEDEELKESWLQPIIDRALAKEKEERFQDAEEFIDALDYAVEAADSDQAFAPTREQGTIELGEDQARGEEDEKSGADDSLVQESDELFSSKGERSNTMDGAPSPFETPSEPAQATSDSDRAEISAPMGDESSSSSIITVLEPSPEEDVIVLDEPKEEPPAADSPADPRPGANQPEMEAGSDEQLRSEEGTIPEPSSLEPAESSPEPPSSSPEPPDTEQHVEPSAPETEPSPDDERPAPERQEDQNETADADESWSWDDSASVPGDEFEAEMHSTAIDRQTNWIPALVGFVIVLAFAIGGYLYVTGQIG